MQEMLIQLEIDGCGREVLVFMFFCLETKEPKVQDWIYWLKNEIFFQENPQTCAD